MTENIVSANEKYAEHVGRDYARANNEVQASLLNGLFGSLRGLCKGDEETQLYYIWSELTPETKAQIQNLAAFGEDV